MQKNQQWDSIIMGFSGEKSCRCKGSYAKKVNIFCFKIVRNSQMYFLVFGKHISKKFKEKFMFLIQMIEKQNMLMNIWWQ